MKDRLMVVVPGLKKSIADWEPLIAKLRQEEALKDADWLPWDHHTGILSRGKAIDKAKDLSAVINEQWEKYGPYEHITLIGHSMGGVLVRQAYLQAAGAYPESQGWSRRAWAAHVDRFVLLAAVNNGFNPKRLSGWKQVVANAGWALGLHRILVLGDFVQGSAAIVNMRINWIRYGKEMRQQNLPAPEVIQLLGRRDSVVTEDDSIDLGSFPDAVHKDVAEATHSDLFRLDTASDPDARYTVLRNAIVGSNAPQESLRELAPASEPKNPVIFALHGIRSSNDGWVEDVQSIIRERAPTAEVVTLSYGYLPALRFALPHARRRNIGWFQSEYSRCLALYPHATFHFIGHSNGTYLLGAGLKALSGMRFDRVALAGCVLPREYPWHERFERGQVQHLRNDRATKDVPVGWLCSGLRGLAMRDVGTAGVDGFLGDYGRSVEVAYHVGGHGRALEPSTLPQVVDWVLGRVETPLPPNPDGQPSKAFGVVSRISPFAPWAWIALWGVAFRFWLPASRPAVIKVVVVHAIAAFIALVV
jgi:alpha-beta hydrolase superfamily lysophospholipase